MRVNTDKNCFMKVKLIFYLGIILCKYFMLSIAMRLWCGIIPFHKSTLHSTSLHFALDDRYVEYILQSHRIVNRRIVQIHECSSDVYVLFNIHQEKTEDFLMNSKQETFPYSTERTNVDFVNQTHCVYTAFVHRYM